MTIENVVGQHCTEALCNNNTKPNIWYYWQFIFQRTIVSSIVARVLVYLFCTFESSGEATLPKTQFPSIMMQKQFRKYVTQILNLPMSWLHLNRYFVGNLKKTTPRRVDSFCHKKYLVLLVSVARLIRFGSIFLIKPLFDLFDDFCTLPLRITY